MLGFAPVASLPVAAAPAASTTPTYTLTAAGYVPGSINATGVTPRVEWTEV